MKLSLFFFSLCIAFNLYSATPQKFKDFFNNQSLKTYQKQDLINKIQSLITNESEFKEFINTFFSRYSKNQHFLNTIIIEDILSFNPSAVPASLAFYKLSWISDITSAIALITLLKEQPDNYFPYPLTNKNLHTLFITNLFYNGMHNDSTRPVAELFFKEFIRIFPQALSDTKSSGSGNTFLHYAAQHNYLNLVLLLLPHMKKEDILLKNKENKTAFELTTDSLIKELIQHSVNPKTALPLFILGKNSSLQSPIGFSTISRYPQLSADTLIYAFNNKSLRIHDQSDITQACYDSGPFLHQLITSYGITQPVNLNLFTTALHHGLKVSHIPPCADTTKENALEYAYRHKADPALIALLENAYTQELLEDISKNLACISLI